MRRLIFILLMSFISLNSFATSQVPDYIIYKGDTLCLLTNPLESYFKVHNLKFRDLSSVGNFSTACWRGYVAYFEIKEGNLYVVDIINGDYNKDEKGITVMDSVFPNKKEYLLKEYTGLLRIPTGKRTNYVHMGYASEYEGYTFIEIEQGKVLNEKFLSNDEYNLLKEIQYKEYIKTEEFQKHLNKLMENSKDEKPNVDFYIQFLYMFFEPSLSSQNGKLDFGGLK
jgi:hypothetical protein